jgi:predicted permease
MYGALEKSLSFLIFIIIGILLKWRFSNKDEVNGLKNLILTIALPATIFLALLKVNIDSDLLVLPLFAISFNVILFAISPILLYFLGFSKKSSDFNTAKLLLPSLAPGLSCFPFILEFLGDEYLAKAAMADLGNKFFVLFILYLVAIRWHYANDLFKKAPISSKLKSLLKSLITEPVNMFILVALILVSLGITIDNLPTFIGETLNRLSVIMTPLVLLFIGLAVKIKRKQFFQISSLLLLRASIAIFAVLALVSFLDISIKKDILFILVFSLISCSFWPFAHISSITSMEKHVDVEKRTFSMDMALSILALSLPISVLLILGILSAENTFTNTDNILIIAISLLFLGSLYPVTKILKKLLINKSSLNLIKSEQKTTQEIKVN